MGTPADSPRRNGRKPKRVFRGIAARFSAGRWRWRACIRVLVRDESGAVVGQQLTGPLRDTQRQAFDDAELLRAQGPRRQAREVTLNEALRTVIQRKIDEGLQKNSIERAWRYPARKILERFRGAALVETITPELVHGYAVALAGSVGPDTVRKVLGVFSAVFHAAGVPDPCPEVLEGLAKRLRKASRLKPKVEGYDLGQTASVLERARAWRPRGGRLPAGIDLDLLIMELASTTGIRHDELARMRWEDVDLEAGIVWVISKVRELPRAEPILPELRERFERVRAQRNPACPYVVPRCGLAKPNQVEWEPGNRWLGNHRARWKDRLKDPTFHLRKLRRAHGSGLEELGEGYAVIRDALGHTRTSNETMRYLLADARRVKGAKQRLAQHLLPPPSVGSASPGPLAEGEPKIEASAPRRDALDGATPPS